MFAPNASTPGHEIGVGFTHGGYSLLLDSGKAVHNFTHDPQPYNGYSYNGGNACPNTAVCTPGDDSAECPSYLNFSPYGWWNIDASQVPAGALIRSQVTSILLQFRIEYVQSSPATKPMFGGGTSVEQQFIVPGVTPDFCATGEEGEEEGE